MKELKSLKPQELLHGYCIRPTKNLVIKNTWKGHNGPWNDLDTPVRVTAHWSILLLKGYALTRDKKMRSLLPDEFQPKNENEIENLTNDEKYERVLKVLDYISGMTDKYAVNLYRKIKGIEI